MHSQTRKLLAFLADEETDRILDELRSGPRTARELGELLPRGRRTADRRLEELIDLELVDSEASPPVKGKRGPRPRRFRVRDQGVFRFCDSADEFALALAEARASRLREHVEGQRKRSAAAEGEKGSG